MRPMRSRAPSATRMRRWAACRPAGGACAPGASREHAREGNRTMIGRIAGTLLEKTFPQIVVSCNGVGYEIDVPMSTFYPLPGANQPVVLYTHLVVREDAHLLFGFLTLAERTVFRQLLKI